jgi:hypothetical protein
VTLMLEVRHVWPQVSLVDPKTANNVGIALSRYKLGASEIARCVLRGSTAY